MVEDGVVLAVLELGVFKEVGRPGDDRGGNATSGEPLRQHERILRCGPAAERILDGVISDLRELGQDADADRAAGDLLWVVGERAGKVERARYLRRSLGLPDSADPPPPVVDDQVTPLGW